MGVPYTFFVSGIPVPQGSKSAFVRGGRAVVVEGASKSQRDRHAAWRADVTLAARLSRHGPDPITGPVDVRLDFYFPLPKGDQHRPAHTVAPDIDKLVRNVLDGLTNSGLIRDDSQVVMVAASKNYARGPWTPGVNVEVTDLTLEAQGFREALKAEAKRKRRA